MMNKNDIVASLTEQATRLRKANELVSAASKALIAEGNEPTKTNATAGATPDLSGVNTQGLNNP